MASNGGSYGHGLTGEHMHPCSSKELTHGSLLCMAELARGRKRRRERERLFYEENKCSGGMSKYLYMMAANIDDVVPHQRKPPQKLATSAKSPQKPSRGVNQTVSIVNGCSISGSVVGGRNSDHVYRCGL
jgi:hypothetical protein